MIKKQIKIFLFSFFIFLFFWELVVRIKNYPSFILPSPKEVFYRWLETLKEGTLLYHTQVTLKEILGGIFLGVNSAFWLGLFLSKFPTAEKIFSPLIVGFQAIPVLGLAPLIIIWFGTGITSKIIVCALTLFFPVLINTLLGFKNIDSNLKELMVLWKASFWQKLIHLEIPLGLPIFLGGLKIGVTLGVIGAVVGEFVGADQGLGFLINLASGLYDTPLRFAAFLNLSLIAFILYQGVNFLEKKLVKWRR